MIEDLIDGHQTNQSDTLSWWHVFQEVITISNFMYINACICIYMDIFVCKSKVFIYKNSVDEEFPF